MGAGPSGLVAAKHALQAGFDVTVFEASDDLGGQWHTTAAHSGVWPGMHTNTSRAMTAFSDFAAPADHPLHPAAEQIHAYLRAYAQHFGVTDRIRLHTPVSQVSAARAVDGERFDGVIVASGRFRKPRLPPGAEAFAGELMHAFDYPGAEPLGGRAVLVYGNGISGLEIASDLAPHARVTSAFRKPRYVIQKVVDGVSSDWQWYTQFGALERRLLPPGMDAFDGDVIHAFEYPGAGPYRDRRTLVYGNGISGLEIASDLAPVTAVVSAFRKPRYVIQKVVDGVSSDWQWYTAFGALERRLLSRKEFSRTLRDRVLRVAGNPADRRNASTFGGTHHLKSKWIRQRCARRRWPSAALLRMDLGDGDRG